MSALADLIARREVEGHPKLKVLTMDLVRKADEIREREAEKMRKREFDK